MDFLFSNVKTGGRLLEYSLPKITDRVSVAASVYEHFLLTYPDNDNLLSVLPSESALACTSIDFSSSSAKTECRLLEPSLSQISAMASTVDFFRRSTSPFLIGVGDLNAALNSDML
jgi:hypothetical protein